MSETQKRGPGRPKRATSAPALATYRDISPTHGNYETMVGEMDEAGWELVSAESLRSGSIRLHFQRKKA